MEQHDEELTADSNAASTPRISANDEDTPLVQSTTGEIAETQRLNDEEEDVEGDDDDDKEPTFKFVKLTQHVASVYRSGDCANTFLVEGNILIFGTLNGIVHVFSLPQLQPIKSFSARSGSITDISVSPRDSRSSASFTPSKNGSSLRTTPVKSSPGRASGASPNVQQRTNNQTYPTLFIATASIDGLVCVTNLADPRESTFRNFARPLHAVAISPNYRTDKSYICGGTAGELILTTGGKPGEKQNANPHSAAAAAAGWLGSIGIGPSNGTDKVLHHGEGAINAIRWSLSGRYIAWANEHGFRFMRTNVDLESGESDAAWETMGSIGQSSGQGWKARIEWVDEDQMEEQALQAQYIDGVSTPKSVKARSKQSWARDAKEKILLGWGNMITVLQIDPNVSWKNKGNKRLGKPEPLYKVSIRDGIVSGATLYTPSILIALVYRTLDDDDKPILLGTQHDKAKKGRPKFENGLPPDLRLYDLEAPEKPLEVEGLELKDNHRLFASSYYLSTIFVPPTLARQAANKKVIDYFGGGFIEIGKNATRLFGSGASVLSESGSDDRASISTGQLITPNPPSHSNVDGEPSILLKKSGLKVFIQSPYDCILAVETDVSDRLEWLSEHERYDKAWQLVNDNPEAVSRDTDVETRPSTPSRKATQSTSDFFGAESSIENSTVERVSRSSVEQEKLRIGNSWIQQLVSKNEWQEAGEIANKVLGLSSQWEHWILTFAHAQKFDEIALQIPPVKLSPPISSEAYEIILGHYIAHDRVKLKELLSKWIPSLYNIPPVIAAIEKKIETGEIRPNSVEGGVKGRDWNILREILAKLYLADGRPPDALQCFIDIKDARATIELVKEYGIINVVADKVFTFITLGLSSEQMKNASLEELDDLSSEPIKLLDFAAVQGVVQPSDVILQLQSRGNMAQPYLFFYIRNLWTGEFSVDELEDTATRALSAKGSAERRRRWDRTPDTAETTGRNLLSPYGDLLVSLFAEYSRDLLNSFLKSRSAHYTFEHAREVCRKRHYIPELVSILSATGDTKNALHLIIDELNDVEKAIEYAKDIDESSLWNDLLDYSMDKPLFVRALLEGIGTVINPVTLVQRIPEHLEIEGLKHSITRLLRESEMMWSISDGAGRVLRSEVATANESLVRDRKCGFVFDIPKRHEARRLTDSPNKRVHSMPNKANIRGHCAICSLPYTSQQAESDLANEGQKEHLLAFACGHIVHLSCLLDDVANEDNKDAVDKLQRQLLSVRDEPTKSDAGFEPGRIGSKIVRAQMIAQILENRSCIVCENQKL